MTRDEAVEEIQEGLGFRSDLSATIIRRLKKAQRDEERAAVLPWFLLTEYTYRYTEATEERLAKPADFIRGHEEGPLWYYNAAASDEEDVWTPLAKDDIEVNRIRFPGTGSPKAYSEVGANFRIFPTPDAVYQIKHIYYAKALVLDSNIENAWLEHSDLIQAVAGKEVAQLRRDVDAAALFAEREQKARALMLIENEAGDMANRRLIMGDPD